MCRSVRGVGLVSERPQSAVHTIACVALIACLVTTTNAQNALLSDSQLVGDVVELRDLLAPSDFVLSGGRIYALDPKDRRVTVYRRNGTLIKGFGRGGQGPGEFRNPASLDVHGQLVAVTERSGHTSIFDTSGVFLHSFRPDGILHMNSYVRLLGDSLIFIGGLREEPENPYGGKMGHIFTIDGIRKTALMPMSYKARIYQSDIVLGASCDYDGTHTLWCGQTMDYVVRRFDLAGSMIDSLAVAPEYYRPLRERPPRSVRSGRMGQWLESWDLTDRLYSINDTFLIYKVSVGGAGQKLDVIDKRTGNVVVTRRIVKGNLVYVSKEEQVLLVLRPSGGEPLSRIQFVPIAELMRNPESQD